MSRHVSDEDLEKLHIRLSGLTRKKKRNSWVYARQGVYTPEGMTYEYVAIAPATDIICFLDELRQRRRRDGKFGAKPVGDLARTLMEMEVGQTIEYYSEVSRGQLTSARKTARRRMGLENAVWQSLNLKNGSVRITRAPDGSSPHADYTNPIVYQLARMQVGESFLVDKRVTNAMQILARKHSGNPAAHWRNTSLASGRVRVRRTK